MEFIHLGDKMLETEAIPLSKTYQSARLTSSNLLLSDLSEDHLFI
jgi:hypothetical protein